jgi:hypothetical protein
MENMMEPKSPLTPEERIEDLESTVAALKERLELFKGAIEVLALRFNSHEAAIGLHNTFA